MFDVPDFALLQRGKQGSKFRIWCYLLAHPISRSKFNFECCFSHVVLVLACPPTQAAPEASPRKSQVKAGPWISRPYSMFGVQRSAFDVSAHSDAVPKPSVLNIKILGINYLLP
jgi:hypothetical protein